MDKQTIIRAWKDPSYRDHLSPEERAALPESPSGRPLTELDESDLAGAVGGVLIGLYPNPDGGSVDLPSYIIRFTTTHTTSPYLKDTGGISVVLQQGGLAR